MTLLSVDELSQIFSDVTPVEQPASTVCQIQYKPDFAVAYNYFRGLVQQHPDEATDRALQLTELCASLNPANYTVWQHRRQVYKQLLLKDDEDAKGNKVKEEDGGDNDLDSTTERLRVKVKYELELATRLGGTNPKAYQVWYHRRATVEHLLGEATSNRSTTKSASGNGDEKDGSTEKNAGVEELLKEIILSELEYGKQVVKVDGKNYHAWSYRQFLVMTVLKQVDEAGREDLLTKELAYTAELIKDDGRNNSAWNHRWFVITHELLPLPEEEGGHDWPDDDKPRQAYLLDEETKYALEHAGVDPYNESPWRYYVACARRHLLHWRDGVWVRRTVNQYEEDAWRVNQAVQLMVDDAYSDPYDMERTDRQDDDSDDGDEDVDPRYGPVELEMWHPVSPHQLAAIVDLLVITCDDDEYFEEDEAKAAARAADDDDSYTWQPTPRQRAIHLCRCLQTVDPIRQKYWKFRAQRIASGVLLTA